MPVSVFIYIQRSRDFSIYHDISEANDSELLVLISALVSHGVVDKRVRFVTKHYRNKMEM